MAYITTEDVKQIRNKIKIPLAKMGIKGSVKRLHYSKVVLSVKSEGSLINEYFDERFSSFNIKHHFDNLTEDEKTQYFKFKERKELIYKQVQILESLLILSHYRDNTDAMVDYFDVSYYTQVDIIN